MNPTLVDPRDYKIGPDSMPQRGVPKGRLVAFHFNESRIFPGTKRKGWIYVPRQYRRDVPAAVMVVQDGAHHMTMKRPWRLPVVFDNLIHKYEIPVSIGIFLEPGVVPPERASDQPRKNRSYEYDTLGDRYARFLIEEILPFVAKKYNLTDDPNGRMLLGGSSGALCSFNVAWERPDVFRRVFSCVGSYVNLRGANIFPSLVRLCEPRPLRVYLQSGTADLDVFGGNWWAANLDMLAALKYSGYEVNHAWGTAGHDDRHGSAIFVDALRWLWQGYTKPIRAGTTGKPRQSLMRVLVKGRPWKAWPQLGDFTADKLAATPQGGLLALEREGKRIARWSAKGMPEIVDVPGSEAVDFCAAPRGQIYVAQPKERQIAKLSASGRLVSVIANLDVSAICADGQGNVYAADPIHHTIWLIDPRGNRRIAAKTMGPVSCLQLTLDENRLLAGATGQRDGWVFHRKPNGLLTHGAPGYHFHIGYEATRLGAVQIAGGWQGTVYFATQSGIQLANSDGTIAGVIETPKSGGEFTGVALAGRKTNELYAVCGGKVYCRPIQPEGVPGF